MTSKRRGPCTPSTRRSSMSLVADGPEMSTSGRVGSGSAQVGHARAGRGHDDLGAREIGDHLVLQRFSGFGVAGIGVHLTAARLGGRRDHLVPQALQHRYSGHRGLGEEHVAQAGDEQ